MSEHLLDGVPHDDGRSHDRFLARELREAIVEPHDLDDDIDARLAPIVDRFDRVIDLLGDILDRLPVRVEDPVILQNIDGIVRGELDDEAIGRFIQNQLGLRSRIDQKNRLPVAPAERELSDVTRLLNGRDGLEEVHVGDGVPADGLAVDDEHAHSSPSISAADVLPSAIAAPIVGEASGAGVHPSASASDAPFEVAP